MAAHAALAPCPAPSPTPAPRLSLVRDDSPGTPLPSATAKALPKSLSFDRIDGIVQTVSEHEKKFHDALADYSFDRQASISEMGMVTSGTSALLIEPRKRKTIRPTISTVSLKVLAISFSEFSM